MFNKENLIDLSQYKFDSLGAITTLSKILDELENWQSPHKYIVTEYFPYNDKDVISGKKNIDNHQPNTYELYNIKMEIENDGVIYCDDAEGILEEAMYNSTPLPLQTLIMDKIIYIAFQKEWNRVTISFNDGFLRINY